jgi:hypothetical protein
MLTDWGGRFFGNVKTKTVYSVPYRGGPVLMDAHLDYLPSFITVARFETETIMYEFQRATMIHTPAMIVAPYNEGIVFLISPHLEEKNDDMVKEIRLV